MSEMGSRISGLVIGAIAGDGLGSPYVFSKSSEMRLVSKSQGWNLSVPGITSNIMVAGLRASVKYGDDMDALVRAYGQTVNDVSLEPDVVSMRVFGSGERNAGVLRRRSEIDDTGTMCSNQAVARQIVTVLRCALKSDVVLMDNVERDVRLTHADPDVVLLCQVYAMALRRIISGKTRVDVWDDIFKFVPRGDVYKALVSSYYEKPVCDMADYSTAHVAVCMALYHFWHNTPYPSAVRSCILSGGATDVNTAITGGLIGASRGIDSIPLAWREALTEGTGADGMANRALSYAQKLTAPHPAKATASRQNTGPVIHPSRTVVRRISGNAAHGVLSMRQAE